VIDASLEIPDKVRDLQIKLYRKAKKEPGFRFYQLYDKVYREDVLLRAWMLAKARQGAPGVDGKSFDDIESEGVTEWLNGLGKELHDRTYQPQPVRRVMIPKPGGGERALGIPGIRDRVAQTAAKLILGTDLRGGSGAECLTSGEEALVSLIQDKVGFSSALVVTTGRIEVRWMRSRRQMNCCTRAIRKSLTPTCRNTLTRSRTPS